MFFSGGKSPTITSDVKQFINCCELIYGKLENEEKTNLENDKEIGKSSGKKEMSQSRNNVSN